jgi:hypothetical protein
MRSERHAAVLFLFQPLAHQRIVAFQLHAADGEARKAQLPAPCLELNQYL